MSRVVMFVFNPCRMDARVLRETATLGAARHDVTVIARTDEAYAAAGEREARDGFEIVRVGIPRDRALRRFVRMPWRSVRDAAGQIRAALRDRPPRLRRATDPRPRVVVSLPWVLLRHPPGSRRSRERARPAG